MAYVMLDTGVVTCLALNPEDSESAAAKSYFLGALDGSRLTVCPVVVAEAMHREYLSSLEKEETEILREFIESCDYMPITENTPYIYADLCWGKKFQNDQWIAAIAIENNIALATRDKEFSKKAAGRISEIFYHE